MRRSPKPPQSTKPRQPIAAAPQSKLAPGLHLVATPIGNLRDITLRALDALGDCDAIYCEDTRVTRTLLSAYGISTPTHSYHDHNAARVRPAILQRLAAGEAVCLVSDAGTPLISDPGLKLVQEAAAAGHAVTALPGPCAAVAALTLSGLATDRFTFVGFLPTKPAARRSALRRLADLPGTLVVYEAASRIARSLADLAEVLGPRRAALARELTKRFEEVRRGRLDVMAREVADGAPLKGEIVLIVGPAELQPSAEASDVEGARPRLAAALERASTKDAVAEVAAATGLPRRALYRLAVSLKSEVPS